MARHLRIIGLVQGVGYRASFERQARALNLSGWVRNRTDGSVEAMVNGSPDAIEKIIAWAGRGPAVAQVREVVVNDADDGDVVDGYFEVRSTV
ncbi:MAG TPA: acylphosphatase [Noviherbaspirillum sp.]|uniref:acylphosphatase n=1 Tax=Noviherbaspirillum sp. TaxID=1926288 RepID=UPI002B469931|nr:acylphosphatase [Noviherbaspirillum sp.]HJV87846.1 acylphosphatase [Noviherbaspirillum sp.]